MNELLSQCLAIAASLCVTGPTSIEVDKRASWQGAKITIGDVRVISTTRTDNFAYPDRTRMSTHCYRRRACIYYHRNCETTAEKAVCIIYFNESHDRFNRSIQLSADTYAAITSAIARLSLVTASGKQLIALSDLSTEATSATPPLCRPGVDHKCD